MAGKGLISIYLPLFFFILHSVAAHRGMLLGGKRRADLIGNDSSYATWTHTSPAINVFGFVQGKIGIRNEIPAFDSVVGGVEERNAGLDRRAARPAAGKRRVDRNSNQVGRLFSRQATCPTGFSPCSDNRNVCCPTGGSCCVDGTCCASGFQCVFQTTPTKIVCCPTGATCAGTSPCEDPGYVLCQGQNFCCPAGFTCFRDTLGVGKCNPPNTSSTGSTGSSTSPTQTNTNTNTSQSSTTSLSTSNSTTPTTSPTTSPTTQINTTPTTPITTPTSATTNGGVTVITTRTTSTVGAGAPTAEPQNITSNNTPVGAIAGGVVGGVAALIIIAVAVFIYLRKRRNAEEEPEVLPSPTLPFDFAPQMAQLQREEAMYATSLGSGGGGGGGYTTSLNSGNASGAAGYGAGGYNVGGFAAPAAAGAAGVGAYRPHYQKRTSYPNPNQGYGGYDEAAYGGMAGVGTSPDPGPDPFRTSPTDPRHPPLPNPSPYYSNAPHLGSYGALPSDQRYSGVSQDQRYSGVPPTPTQTQTQNARRYSAQGGGGQTGYLPPQTASTNDHSTYSHYYGPSTGNTASFYGGDSPNRTAQFGQAR